MTCNEFLDLLDDWTGEPGRGIEPAAVEAHAAICESCQRELALARRLARDTAALAKTLEPGRDLWAGIATRIDAERPAPRLWLQVAAALVLATGLPFLLQWMDPGPMTNPQPTVGSAVPAATGTTPMWQRELFEARAVLHQEFAARRAALPPETADAVTENLEIIDRAILEIQDALAEQPESRRLAMQLADRLHREAALLKRFI